MLAKCANPSCSTPFVYLREGKVFMMEHVPAQSQPGPGSGGATRKPVARVEHFWLCGDCSSHMTLVYDRQQGVRVVSKPMRARAAAS